FVVGLREPRDLNFGQDAHLHMLEPGSVDARYGVRWDQAPNRGAAEHQVQKQQVVMDCLRRETLLGLERDVAVDQVGPSGKFGQLSATEVRKEVTVEDVSVVLERRPLEVASGQVLVEAALAEGGEAR